MHNSFSLSSVLAPGSLDLMMVILPTKLISVGKFRHIVQGHTAALKLLCV